MEGVPVPAPPRSKKEEEKREQEEENVIAHAVPVSTEAHHNEQEEHELHRLGDLIAQAEDELTDKVSQFKELLGEENWAPIEEDPIFQDVASPAFEEKFLESNAPLVRRIAQLRVELHKLQQQQARLQARQGARSMTPLDLWEHIQDLRAENRALREELEHTIAQTRERLARAIAGTAAEWSLEMEIITEVPVDLNRRRDMRGWQTALWGPDSNFIAVEENNSSGCWWIWNLMDNTMHEIPLPCAKDSNPSVLWHPNESLIAFLLRDEKRGQVKVWNAAEQEWLREGYMVGECQTTPELVGWQERQLIVTMRGQGGKLWIGPQLVFDTKDRLPREEQVPVDDTTYT